MRPEVPMPSSRPEDWMCADDPGSPPMGGDRETGGGVHLIGRSPAFLAMVELTRRVAKSRLPVVFVGETGTGKELFARYLHEVSRRAGEFVDIDCGTLPPDLSDSLLFGHCKGAFTGAHEDRRGFLEQADSGTLFLDELGSLESGTQRKLLRALEFGEFRRIGGGKRKVTFRLVAAVQPDIRGRIREGEFRLDLMHRMAGAVVRIPSLADRREDIGPIAEYYAKRSGTRLTPGASATLSGATWPGNVRELRLAVERAALFARGSEIDERAIQDAMALGLGLLTSPEANGACRSARRRELQAACSDHAGDPEAVAEALGVSRSTLYRRLSSHGLDLKDYRRAGVA